MAADDRRYIFPWMNLPASSLCALSFDAYASASHSSKEGQISAQWRLSSFIDRTHSRQYNDLQRGLFKSLPQGNGVETMLKIWALKDRAGTGPALPGSAAACRGRGQPPHLSEKAGGGGYHGQLHQGNHYPSVWAGAAAGPWSGGTPIGPSSGEIVWACCVPVQNVLPLAMLPGSAVFTDFACRYTTRRLFHQPFITLPAIW